MADPIYVKICINIISVSYMNRGYLTVYYIVNSCYVWGVDFSGFFTS